MAFRALNEGQDDEPEDRPRSGRKRHPGRSPCQFQGVSRDSKVVPCPFA